MGIFVDYLCMTYDEVAPLEDTPLTLITAVKPIVINSIIISNTKIQPIRFSLQRYVSGALSNVIIDRLEIPPIQTVNNGVIKTNTVNILEAIKANDLHLPINHSLVCFVYGYTQIISIDINYTLITEL